MTRLRITAAQRYSAAIQCSSTIFGKGTVRTAILVPYGILAFFVLFYEFAPYVYFSLLAAVPALLIVWTAKTARELVIVLQLVLVTSLTFGIGLAAAIGF